MPPSVELGRHLGVVRRTLDESLRQPEVEDLGHSLIRDEDVRRLDVPMHDAGFVRDLEGVGQLGRYVDDLLGVGASGRHPVLQRRAFEQLHHQERLALVLAEVVDGADVGVVECRRGTSLALEALERLDVLRHAGRQELDRHLAGEVQVLGAVDDTHASAAEPGQDSVMGNRRADHISTLRVSRFYRAATSTLRTLDGPTPLSAILAAPISQL